MSELVSWLISELCEWCANEFVNETYGCTRVPCMVGLSELYMLL